MDRARLEREGDLILEAEAMYEEKRKEEEEERKAKEIWKKIEDRQRLEREGDEMMEVIKQHERVEEEMKEERIEKAVKEFRDFAVGGWYRGEEGMQRIEEEGTEERMEREVAQGVVNACRRRLSRNGGGRGMQRCGWGKKAAANEEEDEME